MKLFLVRHGETHSNVIGALDTAVPGAPLDELGLRQAAAIPAAVVARGFEIETISVSTLTRTQQTAAPLAAALDLTPTIRDGLKEIQAGANELKNDPHSQHVYNTTAWAWAGGDLQLRMPSDDQHEGESGLEFFRRFDAAIDEVVGGSSAVRGTALAVSHGAAIRTWVAARCDNTDGAAFAGTHQLANTALVQLHRTRRGTWHLDDWGSAPLGGTLLADETAIDPTGMAEG